MKALIVFLAAALLVTFGILGFAYSGLYNVAASSPHSELSNWLMSTTLRASIKRRAGGIDLPNLDDDVLVRAGANDFDAMCAGCHGAPGQAPEAIGQGLNPPATDLAKSAGHMNAAELFWVTKHGIKMTGMPAWGATHDDDALWPVVALLTKLPELDEDSYRALLASAEGAGHHEPADDPQDDGHNEPADEPQDDGHQDHQH
jgi:mono/diheme cytochrome c family protein